jgi:hypothetical protein
MNGPPERPPREKQPENPVEHSRHPNKRVNHEELPQVVLAREPHKRPRADKIGMRAKDVLEGYDPTIRFKRTPGLTQE